MTTTDDFEDPVSPGPDAAEGFVLDLEGFEGPIDLLLSLAREQKVDIVQISILELADQYLGFVNAARRLHLEVAAEYLVMAAWLAFLKSRLLLPPPEDEDGPSGEELAAQLALRLRRLEAMRDAGSKLVARPQLHQHFHPRGAPEGLSVTTTPVFEATLYDLLTAYASLRQKEQARTLTIARTNLFSIDEAVERLSRLVGRVPDWEELQSFLPDLPQSGVEAPLLNRSALASTFVASLELAKSGRLELRQSAAYGPIYLRKSAPRPVGPGSGGDAGDE
ncbi:MAG: ScpA family protein [Alphaproteobacteria bacterium]|nr:ScpA family protein [Alphaproteobacteria bacterium]